MDATQPPIPAVGLAAEMKSQGDWLFRWRSYLPVPLFLLALAAATLLSPRPSLDAVEPWEIGGLVLGALGILMRAMIVGQAAPGTSGRNTRAQVADTVNTTGWYSVLRHPLYLANALMWMGVAVFTGVWPVILLVMLIFWIYYERIMIAEEAFLREKFGADWAAWAARTPAFLPDLRRWVPADRPFSLREALRREYSGLFAFVACVTVLELASNWRWGFGLALSRFWIAFFLTGLVTYAVLRTLKRHTRLLRAPAAGRP